MYNFLCPACLSSQMKFLFNKINIYGKFPVFICKECKSAFIFPRPSFQELETFYKSLSYRNENNIDIQRHYKKIMESERKYPNTVIDSQRIISNCLELCGKPGKICDIGAGYGFFSHVAKNKGFDVIALEPSPSSRKIFRLINGFDAIPDMMTSEFVNSHLEFFKIALMSQVLEHIADLDQCVLNLNKLLKPKGICCIAVPHYRSVISILQGRQDMFIIPPEHLNFFTIKGIESLFFRYGFELIKKETISRFDFSKLERKLNIGKLGGVIIRSVSTTLKYFDKYHKGMFINAYFRKI